MHILSAGLCIKQYPVCYSGHRAIDAVLNLTKIHNLKVEDIKEIRATIGRAQASMLRNHVPKTGLEAKFSLEFAIASALLRQSVGLSELNDEFVLRPEVQALFSKIFIEITDNKCEIEPAFAYSDRIVIQLKNNQLLDSGEIRFAKGNSKNPLSLIELKAKFIDCFAIYENNDQSLDINPEQLFSKLSDLNHCDSIKSIFLN